MGTRAFIWIGRGGWLWQAMTNLSHVVNHLSFGPPVDEDIVKRLERWGTSGLRTPILAASGLSGKAVAGCSSIWD